MTPDTTFRTVLPPLKAIDFGDTTYGVSSLAGRENTVEDSKAIDATGGAYIAGDVVSEDDAPAAGTAWTFAAIARINGASGYITKVHVINETTAVTPRFVLYFFTALPTSELDDNAPNTALDHGDIANYVGKVDLAATESIPAAGPGDSESVATPSTTGSLPLAFTCDAAADDLYGILVTRDGFTQVAGEEITIRVTAEQY